MLEKAMILAAKGHAGQVDKGGQPYILHPVRVMLQCETLEEKIVAILHDLLEDTEYTAQDLEKEGFPAEIMEAVSCLTRREGEEYMAYIEKVCKNPLAARVKYADLMDNMDISRIPNPTEKDHQRLKKYAAALQRIKETGKG
ncbi:GTP pyrophosphokinase [Anaerotignum sp.]